MSIQDAISLAVFALAMYNLLWTVKSLFHSRKRSPASRKSPSDQATKHAKFFEVIPASPEFGCAAYTAEGKPCSANKSHSVTSRRHLRHTLRETLAIRLPDQPAWVEILHHYANHCICFSHKNKLDEICHKWAAELRELHANLLDFHTTVLEPGQRNDDPCILLIRKIIPLATSSTSSADLLNYFIAANILKGKQWCPGSFPVDTTATVDANALAIAWKDKFAELPGGISPETLTDFDGERSAPVSGSPRFDQYVTWAFEPYRPRAHQLQVLILKPLTPVELPKGWIYMYSRTGDEGFLKIGYTTQTVDERLSQWRECCDSDIKLEYEREVAHAKRTEGLIHGELHLLALRYQETRCKKKNLICAGKKHTEWFKIDKERGIKTIDYWVEWMGLHSPYTAVGSLQANCLLKMFTEKVAAPPNGKLCIHDSKGDVWFDLGKGDTPRKATPGRTPNRRQTMPGLGSHSRSRPKAGASASAPVVPRLHHELSPQQVDEVVDEEMIDETPTKIPPSSLPTALLISSPDSNNKPFTQHLAEVKLDTNVVQSATVSECDTDPFTAERSDFEGTEQKPSAPTPIHAVGDDLPQTPPLKDTEIKTPNAPFNNISTRSSKSYCSPSSPSLSVPTAGSASGTGKKSSSGGQRRRRSASSRRSVGSTTAVSPRSDGVIGLGGQDGDVMAVDAEG